MNAIVSTKAARMKEWAAIIQDRSSSGMSVKKYCEINHIRKGAYFYWLRQLRRTEIESESKEELVEIRFSERRDEEQSRLTEFVPLLTIQAGGAQIGVNNDTPMGLLSDVMGVLANAQ